MPYQAEARIICRISGTLGDVSVGAKSAAAERQPSFNSTAITQRLMTVPAATVGQVPDDDEAVCRTKAAEFIMKELPSTYALAGQASATRGHAYLDGHWVPIGGGLTSYAFPLTLNGLPVEQESVLDSADGKEQTITLSWWVVIQPK